MLTADSVCGRLHLSIVGWHISLWVYSVSICRIIFYDQRRMSQSLVEDPAASEGGAWEQLQIQRTAFPKPPVSSVVPQTSLWGRVSPAHHFLKINVHHFLKINVHHFAEVGVAIYCFLTDFSSHRPVFDSDFTLDFREYLVLLVSEIL